MRRLTEIGELAGAATAAGWASFAGDEGCAGAHFARNVDGHEALNDDVFETVELAVLQRRLEIEKAGRKRLSGGEFVYDMACNSGQVSHLIRIPATSCRAPVHKMSRLTAERVVKEHFTDVTVRRGDNPRSSRAAWRKGARLANEKAPVSEPRPGPVPRRRQMWTNGPKAFFFTHEGREGVTIPADVQGHCQATGVAYFGPEDEMVEVRIKSGARLEFCRATVFDSFPSGKNPAEIFPDWLARPEATSDAPCGRTRDLESGEARLPELIVFLDDGAEVEVISRGPLNAALERTYLRRMPP